MSIVERINELRANYETARLELITELRPQFHSMFAWYFEKYPYVANLNFKAYTPYFNDGETCEYRVNELCASLKDRSYDDDYNENYSGGEDTILPYGLHVDDIMAYRSDGTVTYNMGKFTSYYCEPRVSQDWRTGMRRETPPIYSSVADYINTEQSWIMEMSDKEILSLQDAEDDLRKCQGILESFGDDIIKEIFGDHVHVFIKKDEIVIEEYDHE